MRAIGRATDRGRNVQADRGRSRAHKIARKQAPTTKPVKFILKATWTELANELAGGKTSVSAAPRTSREPRPAQRRREVACTAPVALRRESTSVNEARARALR